MAYSYGASSASSWQEKLEERCRELQYHTPIFQIVSDRRGGRTAWSSTVTIQGQNIAARYWYDGQYVHNAKEDAAEVALKHLNCSSPSSPTQSRSGWIWDLDGTPLGIGAWNWRKHKEPFGVWYYYGLTGQRERWSSNNSQQQYLVSLDKVFLWIGMKTLDWIVKTSRGYTRSDIDRGTVMNMPRVRIASQHFTEKKAMLLKQSWR